MNCSFVESMMRHLVLMDKIKVQSAELYHLSFTEKVDQLLLGLENRDRMVAELNRLQNKICADFKEETATILECWTQDLNKFIQLIARVDQEITSVLEFQKDRTAKEISSLYQNKENIKKYNLNSLR